MKDLEQIKIHKKRSGRPPLTMLTAYDYFTARLLEECGIDIILVGDSVASVIAGYETTLPVTMDEMLYHVKAVSRGARNTLIVADMPFLSYQVSTEEAIRNAGRFLKEGGAHAVKLEGGALFADVIKALVRASIPVMGHVGLLPQSVFLTGGYKIRGKTEDEEARIIEDARKVEEAGAFAVVVEGVKSGVASALTSTLAIPVIGIGAGKDCDGQVLVTQDILNMTYTRKPKFVRVFEDSRASMEKGIRKYIEEVRAGTFPDEEHSY